MTFSHRAAPLRRGIAMAGITLPLLFALATPAAAQDSTATKPDSAAAAAQAAAAAEACTKLKDYAKQVVTDSIKALWTAGTLFRNDDSTSKQISPVLPRMSFDSASVPANMRATATTAGSSCRATPNSQAMMQMVQTQLGAPRPLIGVQFQSVTAKDTAGFGLPNTRGLLVMAVTPGMGAATAGVAKGDIIIGLDGQPLATINQFMSRASQWKDGQTIKLEVVRTGGKHETLEIKTKTNK